jgi:cytochrome c-type biogenesis protein CcmE
MATGTRLAIGGLVVASVTAYLACVGVSSSWQYYLTVDECMAQAGGLVESPVRVSGQIAADSLHVATDRMAATFVLEGTNGSLRVRCKGPLPDNLAEGRQAVVQGRLQRDGQLLGDQVLTRCASKYSSQAPLAASERLESR